MAPPTAPRRCGALVACAALALARRCAAARLPPERPIAGAAAGAGALARRCALLPGELVAAVLGHIPLRYQLASCTDVSEVTLWDAGGTRGLLLANGTAVSGVSYPPKGDRALTWSAGGMAIVWDAVARTALSRLRHSEAVLCAAVSPMGDRVLTCGASGHVLVWDAGSGEASADIVAPGAKQAVFFPSGGLVLTWGHGDFAEVWDAATGTSRCRLARHTDGIDVARVFPGGDRVVTGGRDGRAIVWDAAACRAVHEFAHPHWLSSVAVLLGGEAVATLTGLGAAAVWSARSGRLLHRIAEANTWTPDLFDGLVPFPGGGHVGAFHLRGFVVWDVTAAEASLRRFSVPDFTWGLAVSPDGGLVATCGSNQVMVWDMASGDNIHTFSERRERRPRTDAASSCLVDFGLLPAFDPGGLGAPGATFRDLL